MDDLDGIVAVEPAQGFLIAVDTDILKGSCFALYDRPATEMGLNVGPHAVVRAIITWQRPEVALDPKQAVMRGIQKVHLVPAVVARGYSVKRKMKSNAPSPRADQGVAG